MSDPQEVKAALAASLQMPGPTPTRASRRPSKQRRPIRCRQTPVAFYFPDKLRTGTAIDAGLRDVLRRALRNEIDWPLFIYGAPGVGKTCAALAILDYTGGVYFTAETLSETVIEAQQGRLRTPVEKWPMSVPSFWAEMYESSIVVLDELGSIDRVKQHPYGVVKRMLDEREGAPLIVLSNLGLAELGQLYDQRITSRLAGGTVVHLKGQDRRPKKENRSGRQEGREEGKEEHRPRSQGDEPADRRAGAAG